jgi:uncharacterized protein YndB with AHSA1/START domain
MTTTGIVCKVSLDIKAPISRVWDALINPEKIKKYLFGTNTTSDWKVGSSITFTGEWEGKAYEDKGTILQIEKEKIFKYNYWSNFSGDPEIPENYQDITYALHEKGGITTFTVTQENCKSEEIRDHSVKNWTSVMQCMKDLLEKGEI